MDFGIAAIITSIGTLILTIASNGWVQGILSRYFDIFVKKKESLDAVLVREKEDDREIRKNLLDTLVAEVEKIKAQLLDKESENRKLQDEIALMKRQLEECSECHAENKNLKEEIARLTKRVSELEGLNNKQ